MLDPEMSIIPISLYPLSPGTPRSHGHEPIGVKVPFFKHLATTTSIPAQLIKKYNCDLVPIYIERDKLNHFKMYVSEPIKINKNKNISEITAHLNKILEKMIKKNIDQWIWTHDRWKN